MAEPATTTPEPSQALAEYDQPDASFDRDLDSQVFAKPTTPSPPAADPNPAPAAPLPRNPDGTFAPKTSSRLVTQARQLGFTEEEIANTPSTDLAALVMAELHQQLLTKQIDRQAAPAQAPQTVEVEPEWGTEEDGSPVDPKSYSGGLVNALRAQAKQIAAMKAQLDELTGFQKQELQRRNESFAQAVDRVIDEINHPSMYGTGRGSSMKPDQPELLARKMLLSRAAAMPGGVTKANLVAAHRSMLGQSEPEPAPRNGHPSRADWDQAALLTPTHRRTPPEPNGTAKAVKNTAARMRELGIHPDSDASFEEDRILPD